MEARSIKPEPGSGTQPVAGGARKQRVLFVDDEAPILEALRAVLRPQRLEWDMLFALGGPAGLQEVEGSKAGDVGLLPAAPTAYLAISNAFAFGLVLTEAKELLLP